LNPIKKLISQTAVYGLSHIAGRLLTFLFLPLYTGVFSPEEYGILSLLLVAVAFMNIAFTYGMETAFFRFISKEDGLSKTYPTGMISIFFTTIFFGLLLYLNNNSIATYFELPHRLDIIHWLIAIIVIDTLCVIPLAYLRYHNKVFYYAGLKLLNVAVIILFNLIFLLPMIPDLGLESYLHYLPFTYDKSIGIGYIILANLIASSVVFLLLIPTMLKTKWVFDFIIWKKMVRFGAPLIVVGLAGMVNELMDRILLKEVLPGDNLYINTQIGIYSACYKLAMIIALVNTAFRQAAEPFFFSQEKEKNAQRTYADIMKYYTICCLFVFLIIALFIQPIANLMINSKYHEGLSIVPILLLANILLGIYYNLSVWYKLTQKTLYGMYISILGALTTIALNLMLIPEYGYKACAVTTLICYMIMVLISYFAGKKHYPVPYNIKRILLYSFIAVSLFFICDNISIEGSLDLIIRLICIGLFLISVLFIERPNKFLNSG